MKILNRDSLIFKVGIAAVDQAILSLSNFCLAMLLIKFATKIDYGYYSVVFSMLLFLTSIQNAIVNAPLAVLLANKKKSEKNIYAGSLCYGQLFVVLPAVCIGLFIIAFLRMYGLDSGKTLIAISFCVAAIGTLLREYIRSYFFAQENPSKVLIMDSIFTIFYLGLVIISYLIFGLKTFVIFILMGGCALIIGFIYSQKQNWKYNFRSIKKSYRENWKYGKWALVGATVAHIQTYSYIYLLGALLGSVAVAEVNAARIFFMPLVLLQMGWGQLVIPYGSRLREQNNIDVFIRHLILVLAIYVVIFVIYIGLLRLFQETLMHYILSEKYANSLHYFYYWGVIFIFGIISINANYGLQVTKKFDVLAKVEFMMMIITIFCSFIFIKVYGIKGSLFAIMITKLVQAAILWVLLLRVSSLRKEGFANQLPNIPFLKIQR
jgi:O-antigen/teichoic acid export membrane protein